MSSGRQPDFENEADIDHQPVKHYLYAGGYDEKHLMHMKRILEMAVVATSGMTLFSYMVSFILKEKFLETSLLNQLIFAGNKKGNKNHPAGFIVHYAVGTFFSSFYYRIWNSTGFPAGNPASISMGFLNGILGMTVWHIFFLLHSNPPSINYRKYYIQLVIAHVLFGYLNGLIFRREEDFR